ncbi:MAG TPA: LysE family translocator [Acidimicrobiales bacterium]
MASSHSLAAFAALTFALIVVPGPSVMFVISRAVTLGRRAALVTVAGNALGIYVQVLLVAAGLGVVVERSIAAFTAVKLAGSAYLIWLGIEALRHRKELAAGLGQGAARVRSPRSVFVDGMVVGASNAKAIVFFAAILPQFVTPGGAPAVVQMAVLGIIAVGIALVSDGAWALLAGTARQWFARSPRRLERIGGAGGLVMVGLGVRLAATGRHD